MSLNPNDLIALIMDLSPVPGLDADTIAANDQLLTGGLIDSMGLLQVVEAIEKGLGRAVPPSEISIDNFNSLAAIAKLQAKLAA